MLSVIKNNILEKRALAGLEPAVLCVGVRKILKNTPCIIPHRNVIIDVP
jgi:hypothetical protein